MVGTLDVELLLNDMLGQPLLLLSDDVLEVVCVASLSSSISHEGGAGADTSADGGGGRREGECFEEEVVTSDRQLSAQALAIFSRRIFLIWFSVVEHSLLDATAPLGGEFIVLLPGTEPLLSVFVR